jgi:HrpA-like RNA helicase
MDSDEQMLVFDKAKERERKVILSTNIAETSVTVP